MPKGGKGASGKRAAAKSAAAPRSRSTAGRPTTLTPEIQKEICDYMAAGNFLDTSCYLTNQSVGTVKSWLKFGNREAKRRQRGLKPHEPHEAFYQFSVAVKKASAEAEARNVMNINTISRGQPAREITRERILPDGTIERTVEKHSAVPAQWTASAWFLERTKYGKFGRKDTRPPAKPPGADVPETPAAGDGKRPLVVRERDE
jgi:hypothetical protein